MISLLGGKNLQKNQKIKIPFFGIFWKNFENLESFSENFLKFMKIIFEILRNFKKLLIFIKIFLEIFIFFENFYENIWNFLVKIHFKI